MRGYTVITSAVALNVDYKWLDNVLSHNAVAGVRQARQGVSRSVPFSALRILAIALRFIEEMEATLPKALVWAEMLAQTGMASANDLSISINVEGLDGWLAQRLAFAVEVAPVPRRGRPKSTG